MIKAQVIQWLNTSLDSKENSQGSISMYDDEQVLCFCNRKFRPLTDLSFLVRVPFRLFSR